MTDTFTATEEQIDTAAAFIAALFETMPQTMDPASAMGALSSTLSILAHDYGVSREDYLDVLGKSFDRWPDAKVLSAVTGELH